MNLCQPNYDLVTFILLTYNQEQFVSDAVKGAFAQTYSRIQFILSDDCSTDSTFSIMEDLAECYSTSKDVIVRQNKENLGIAAHLNEVMKIAKGDIIVIAAGDDISLPDRTRISVDILKKYKNATSVLLSSIELHGSSYESGSDRLRLGNHVELIQNRRSLSQWNYVTFGASRVFRRSLFTVFGPLDKECPTEDTPLLLRSLILGDNILSSKKGIVYRIHENNLSGLRSISEMDMSKIYKQYYSDLRFARNENLIGSADYLSFRKWIVESRKVNLIKLKIRSGLKLSANDYRFIIRHKAFGSRFFVLLLCKKFLF